MGRPAWDFTLRNEREGHPANVQFAADFSARGVAWKVRRSRRVLRRTPKRGVRIRGVSNRNLVICARLVHILTLKCILLEFHWRLVYKGQVMLIRFSAENFLSISEK